MRKIFVTATDTDAGKTFVTSALVRALKQAGHAVRAAKPVACGVGEDGIYSDISTLLAAQDMAADAVEAISCYRFAAPLAPMQASAVEGASLEPERLLAWCNDFCKADAVNVIEGVGGLMVPLAPDYLVADWITDLPDAEILLVVRSRLGGINHMLLTLDKLERMGRMPKWIVINDADAAGEAMLERHREALPATFTHAAEVASFPFAGGSGKICPGEGRLLKMLGTFLR